MKRTLLRIIFVFLVILAVILYCDNCGKTRPEAEAPQETKGRFETIENYWTFKVIRDTHTGVLYAQTNSVTCAGILTVLLDPEGKPLVMEEQ